MLFCQFQNLLRDYAHYTTYRRNFDVLDMVTKFQIVIYKGYEKFGISLLFYSTIVKWIHQASIWMIIYLFIFADNKFLISSYLFYLFRYSFNSFDWNKFVFQSLTFFFVKNIFKSIFLVSICFDFKWLKYVYYLRILV